MNEDKDEIDLIHEAEMEAQHKIEHAEKQARTIRSGTETKVQETVKQAEAEAKKESERVAGSIDSKKAEVEGKVMKDTDAKIAELEATAKKKRTEAIAAVVKMVLGEE
ncbi:MAG: hypothetical protein ACW99U_05435 [Candidatus Thorarchaeota archaeon]|jgi:vacuolar-type H+-ATPase subunit H